MTFDDICDRLNESHEGEGVSVNEHTIKVLSALVERGLISEDAYDTVDE
jgi:hypothetical protein